MTEHNIILKDLETFLKIRGIRARIKKFSDDDVWLAIPMILGDSDFSIFDGHIVFRIGVQMGLPIISLSDPKYREKFAEYLGGYREACANHTLFVGV